MKHKTRKTKEKSLSILRSMKTAFLIAILSCGFTLITYGQLTLSTDYTDITNAKGAIHHNLDVYNRIHPSGAFNLPAHASGKLCVVRPLGGITTSGAADLSKDTYLWDESTQQFYTDFTTLQQQIDNIHSKGLEIYQLVLDNPSWAFQRNPDGTLPGGSYTISTYGNAVPPTDFNAWANYLKDVINFIITTYGQQVALDIQYGIGREIGTAGHWTGTKEEFFDFYAQSVAAIHQVLPGAKVGSHFLWGSSNNPWGTDFVKYCSTNNVHYDHVGVSYYPFFNQPARTNFTEVYTKDFGVIKDIPEWNPNAKLEIHEYALITSMGSGAYDSAEPMYQVSFLVGLMKMFYDNDMQNLFSWGKGDQYDPAYDEILSLKGNTYYTNTKTGSQNSSGNYVDAIFTKDVVNGQYNIMAYNYSGNPDAEASENLIFNATIDVPPGTAYEYRSAVYNENFPWSGWQQGTTTGTLANESNISFTRNLSPFSFLKYEVRILNAGQRVSRGSSDEISKAVNIKLFPNPTSGQFSIDLRGFGKSSVFIYDVNGALITRQTDVDGIFQMHKGTTFKTGIYLVQVVDQFNRHYNQKLIIR